MARVYPRHFCMSAHYVNGLSFMKTHQIDDIVIAFNAERGVPVLARVMEIEATGLLLEVADETAAYESTRQTFEVIPSSILLTLGPNPRCYGTAYGIPLHPFYEKQHIPGWGDLLWMYPHKDETAEKTVKAIKSFLAGIKQDRLCPFVFVTHMRERDKKDKYAGFYKYRPKDESDDMVLLVDDVFPATKHVVAHEYAHGLWHRVMSDNRRADWIELYTSHVELDATKANVVKNVIADCKELSGKGALKTLMSSYRKDKLSGHLQVIRSIIREIKYEYNLSARDVHDLLAGSRTISNIIPHVPELRRGTVFTGVTDYANKSSNEFWCESFALFYTNPDALPDKTYKLVEDTLISLKASR